MKTLLITSLAAVSVLAPGSAQAAACTWSATDLPLPAGTSLAMVMGGSDDGRWVLGWGDTSAQGTVELLWHDGEVESSHLAPGEVPHDVDGRRTVITSTSEGTAWRGSMGLNPVPGANWASPAAINSLGVVAGRSGSFVVTWGASQEPHPIAGTDDGATYQVEDIDDEDRVAATRYGPQGEAVLSHLWDATGARSTLQPPPGYRHTVVRSLRAGQAVGFAAKDGWTDQVGVVRNAQGAITRVLPGSAEATDITAAGDVLGLTADSSHPGPAAVWRATGGPAEVLPAGIYEKFADTGALYGRAYRDGAYVPFEAQCL